MYKFKFIETILIKDIYYYIEIPKFQLTHPKKPFYSKCVLNQPYLLLKSIFY